MNRLSRLRLFVLVPALLAFFSAQGAAHEVRPAFLQLSESEPGVFEVLWKVPSRAGKRLALRPALGELDVLQPPTTHVLIDAFADRWRIRDAAGLVGRNITIEGLGATRTDTLVRLEWLDGRSHITRLTPDRTGFVVPAAPSWLDTAGTYLALGIEHILIGIDHLLFVLALLLLVEGRRRLILAITAFTLAHSLTLGMATLGVVHVPGPPIEAVIALSIVFLSTEILQARRGRPGLTSKRPWIAAFTFGLLHGFGFAGALSEIGLPEGAIPTALLFFNVGVELGQLLFVGVVLALLGLASQLRFARWPRMAEVAALGIGTVASYWTFERIAGF